MLTLDANGLVLYFPAPQTVTGEDVLELHLHGGNAIVKAVLGAISRIKPHYVRYAEPGEFTRRAFYNGRLDLTEVEALGDTLAAETEQQRQVAVRGSSNALFERYEDWRQKLLDARGELEALIDFSEDQQFDDTPDILIASVIEQIKALQNLLQASIKNAFRGELLRHGIKVALVGAPNAGKSSLLNKIVSREAAIVSSEAGTTRDVVEVGVDIGGFYCRFGDLAGLRRSSEASAPIGEIELEGMRRAKERALDADVVIVVLCVTPESASKIYIPLEVARILQDLDTERQDVVYVVNKSDLLSADAVEDTLSRLRVLLTTHTLPSSAQPPFLISCIDKPIPLVQAAPNSLQGFLDGLIKVFRTKTSAMVPDEAPSLHQSGSQVSWAESLGASERHRVLLQQCSSYLENFLTSANAAPENATSSLENADIDVVAAAEDLRNAGNCLARITGRGEGGDVEEVLGVVFEKCVIEICFSELD